jgi:hypothetical protein
VQWSAQLEFRQDAEREILKRAATFSPRREVGKVPPHRSGKEGFFRPTPMQGSQRQSERLPRLEGAPCLLHQRDDTVLLAHIRSAVAMSNESYVSPRMVHEMGDSIDWVCGGGRGLLLLQGVLRRRVGVHGNRPVRFPVTQIVALRR